MTARKTTPEYDFDHYDEEAALARLRAETRIRYIIVERDFVAKFPDGKIIRIPLKLSLDQVNKLSAEFDNPLDQVSSLLEQIGDGSAAADLKAQDLLSAVDFAAKYFEVLQKVQGATVGEAGGSPA
jgi:hypothetical protein